MSVVFFFKQKTAYDMRISDWSSDVCSSDLMDERDLGITRGNLAHHVTPQLRGFEHIGLVDRMEPLLAPHRHFEAHGRDPAHLGFVIGHHIIALAQTLTGGAQDRKSTRLNSSH